jgi:hypothetical protein
MTTKTAFAKWLMLGGVFLGASAWSSLASAAEGFICYSTYRTNPTSLGSEGNVSFTVWSEPDCSGSMVGGYVLCSTGATAASCATSANRYERNGLLAYFGAMQRAAAARQPVNVSTALCNSGASTCAGYVYFDSL